MTNQTGRFNTYPSSVSQALRDAADLLEKSNWIRHSLWRGFDSRTPSFCMLGSVLAVLGRNPQAQRGMGDLPEKYLPAYEAITATLSGIHNTPAGWNDYQAQDKEDVIQKLREAAEKLDARS